MVTTVWDFCWSFEKFWFETYLPATPFKWFLAIFSLIALWWITELILVSKNKAFKLFNISMLSIVFVFLLAVSAIFYNFNLYYDSTKGLAKKEDLIFYEHGVFEERHFIPAVFINKHGKPTEVPVFEYEHWLAFRDSMTCKRGIDFNLLKADEWSKLYEQYELLKRSEYEKVGLDYDDPGKYSRQKEKLKKELK